MIGIQRVLEGTDWPLCSAVYCVGMPGSLNTVVQFLGRAMRLKGPDYPAEPARPGQARLLRPLRRRRGPRRFVHRPQPPRPLDVLLPRRSRSRPGMDRDCSEVRRGIEAALGPAHENPAAADAENEADEPLDPEVRAEVELAMANAREQIIQSGNEPTAGARSRSRRWLPRLHRVAAEIVAAPAEATGTAVRQAIQQEIARQLRIAGEVGDDVNQHLVETLVYVRLPLT